MAQDAQETERAEPVGRLTKQGKAVPAEAKKRVLEDAKQAILAGEQIDQIAARHGIAPRTLDYWLNSLGDEYKELRQLWVDSMLQEAGDILKDNNQEYREKDADAGLRLARARELWKRATWYAERRDRARYGQDAPPPQSGLTINLNLGANGAVQSAKVIESDSQ